MGSWQRKAPAWLWHRARQSGARRLHLAELRGRLKAHRLSLTCGGAVGHTLLTGRLSSCTDL